MLHKLRYTLTLGALLAILGFSAKLSPIIPIIVAIYAEWMGFDGYAVITFFNW